MVRTRDPVAHATSRAAFVDAAQGLLRANGWDAISMEEVLQVSGASKGALYHYFRSKQSLLVAVVDQMADQLVEQLESSLEGSGGDTAARLTRLFAGLGRWKVERLDVLIGVIRSWQSDANAPARERLRLVMAARVGPLVARCLQRVPTEEPGVEMIELGRVTVTIVQALNDRLADLMLAGSDAGRSRDDALLAVRTTTRAVERVLGLEAGTMMLVTDEQFDLVFPGRAPDLTPTAEDSDPEEHR